MSSPFRSDMAKHYKIVRLITFIINKNITSDLLDDVQLPSSFPYAEKSIVITIDHTINDNNTVCHDIKVNYKLFSLWLFLLKYTLNEVINIIRDREKPIITVKKLLKEIIKREIISDQIEIFEPERVLLSPDSEVKLVEIFNNKIVQYKYIKKSIIDIGNNEYCDEDSFVLDSEEAENEVDEYEYEYEDEDEDEDEDEHEDEDEDEDEHEEEIENQEPPSEWLKDSEYCPPGVTFSQEQLNNIEFMKKNILPREYEKQGPKESLPSNIPPVRDNVIQHVFELYFTDFLNRLVISTNNYKRYKKISAKEKANYTPQSSQSNSQPPWYSLYDDFTLEEIRIYLSIFLFAGLNRITNIHDYWEKPKGSCLSLSNYNPTIVKLMSFKRFKAIHKCFRWEGFGTKHQTANHELIYEYANELIKKHYSPSFEFSFDDDLFGWSGIGGSKKMVPGKADKVGNVLWKLVDKFKYTYHFEIEHLVSKILKAQAQTQDGNDMVDQPKKSKKPNLGYEILNRALNKVKEVEEIATRGSNCFVIDAGYLGGVKNVNLLSLSGFYFIVLIASNRIGSLFNFIEPRAIKSKLKFDNVGDCLYAQNGQYTAIAWQCKKNKMFYSLTNIPKPIFKEK
ncbi:hypothetical protein DICPUDRAFT_83128 [Dictyostelium purpureum]|uniref:PiggyBac transposable element-derived protein domain-containing protein n=1 Tax=Dictyostelium purpureum TaxID=5786 RepID=F0ZYM3_DICPU|nr:uncharacterized protein DICPUDRAFT_83128 [Dictyostelium purpureum]EGC30966.1 hypothetical protein DICPUDRAFT_83128 [Dictyostelium purpureum]|eukprot:XP_003292517.1 hypothetical protein DICPUDRAFT_83128 [Dictyostelium purpureum]